MHSASAFAIYFDALAAARVERDAALEALTADHPADDQLTPTRLAVDRRYQAAMSAALSAYLK